LHIIFRPKQVKIEMKKDSLTAERNTDEKKIDYLSRKFIKQIESPFHTFSNEIKIKSNYFLKQHTK
jgi:hypothetical protein